MCGRGTRWQGAAVRCCRENGRATGALQRPRPIDRASERLRQSDGDAPKAGSLLPKKKGPLTNGSTKFGPMFHRNRRGNKHAVAT